ncbi:MAG: hypothetical protein KBD78_00115 [Oligoflexales bacterium]|nr:hypothetical protein [Oligoflexales bacterium]
MYWPPARGPLNFYAIHGKIIATGSGIPPSPVPLAGGQYKAFAIDSSDCQLRVHTQINTQIRHLFFNILTPADLAELQTSMPNDLQGCRILC